MDVGLGRRRTDIVVRPSSLSGHLRVKIFLPFFFTVGNFSEAHLSNLNPCWRRARADARGCVQTGENARRRVRTRADRCVWGQTGKGARRRVRAGADVYARPHPSACARAHTSAKKMDPSGMHGLVHRDCNSSGWII